MSLMGNYFYLEFNFLLEKNLTINIIPTIKNLKTSKKIIVDFSNKKLIFIKEIK